MAGAVLSERVLCVRELSTELAQFVSRSVQSDGFALPVDYVDRWLCMFGTGACNLCLSCLMWGSLWYCSGSFVSSI